MLDLSKPKTLWDVQHTLLTQVVIFIFFFFKFILSKPSQHLQDIELQEKEEEKDEKHIGKLTRKNKKYIYRPLPGKSY